MDNDVTSLNAEINAGKLELDRLVAMGWDVYRRNFVSILPIVLIIGIPLDIIRSMITGGETPVSGSAGGSPLLTLIYVTMEILFRTLSYLALFWLIDSSVNGNKPSSGEAFRHVFSRWGASIGTTLLLGVILIGMTLLLFAPVWWLFYRFPLISVEWKIVSLLLFLPGVVLWISYSFFLMAVGVRGLSGKRALDYSKGLVQGQWWRVFGFEMVFLLFYIVFSSAIQPLLVMLPASPVVQISAYVVYDLFFALTQAMTMIFFLNIEATKRGAELTPDFMGQ